MTAIKVHLISGLIYQLQVPTMGEAVCAIEAFRNLKDDEYFPLFAERETLYGCIRKNQVSLITIVSPEEFDKATTGKVPPIDTDTVQGLQILLLKTELANKLKVNELLSLQIRDWNEPEDGEGWKYGQN
jgi:hypothetical protein